MHLNRLLFFAVLAICGAITPPASLAAAEKTFVYCSEASPSGFNPQLAEDGPTYNASSQTLYNHLVEFAPGSMEIVPGLADRWEISKDGKRYTFHLRKNVAFHTTPYFTPTRPANADDVLFSFQRALDPKHPFHFVGGGNYPFFSGLGLHELIESVIKRDAQTIEFTLRRPEAPFLANLAMGFAVVLSREYADQLLKAGKPERIDFEPVGTGPFVFKRYNKDNVIRFTAHPDYWRGRAKIDKLVFSITPDANVRYQKLRAGECHLIAEPSPQDLKLLQKGKGGLKVIEQAGANTGFIAFNVTRPPLNKVEVREAITYAMNRAYYIEVVYQNKAVLARGPLPPEVWGSDPKAEPLSYDPARAKALLRKAGYPNGLDVELWTLPVSRPYNPNGRKMGELMQADLAKIGVRLNLVTYDWPTYLSRARQGEHQIIQMGWSTDNGDPDNFLGTLIGCEKIAAGGNMARWCDKDYDRLIEDAKRLTSRQERTRKYIEAERRLAKEFVWVPIAHATVYRGLSAHVENYSLSALGIEDFYPVDLK